MIWKKNHLGENRISAPQTFLKTNFDPKNVMNQCQRTWKVIIGTYVYIPGTTVFDYQN